MSISRSKKTVTAIALFLMLTFAVSIVALPLANAHTPAWTIPTWAFLSVAPNPVGVGQIAYVNFWLDKVPPTANSAYGDRWQNFTVTVTKPNGGTETLGPYASDSVGGAWTQYVPDTVGNYTFLFKFPGQKITGANPHPIFGTSSPEYVNDTYSASTSNTVVLVVQQEPIPPYPQTPLPTTYWKRPIYSGNLDWAKISGNWFGLASSTFAATGRYNATGNFNPYTTAPNTAHILWTKPEAFGGLIGGEFGGTETSNYYSTSQYEPKFAPIIVNGILYYTVYPGASTNPAGWAAVDLRTGETVWTKTNITTPLTCGQVLNYQSPNQYGGLAYLWTGPTGFFAVPGPWSMYDAMTGNHILDIVGGGPMTLTEANDGSLIGYYVNASFPPGLYPTTLNRWNSTRCILENVAAIPSPFYQETQWMWRPPQGATLDFKYGIEWSKPLATNISGVPLGIDLGVMAISSDVILMTGSTAGFGFNIGYQYEAGYSATTGQLLWGPINRTINPHTALTMGPAMNGVYTEYTRETMDWVGYSIKTGEKLWGPTTPNANVWGYYGIQYVAAYNNLYAWDFGGRVNCFDLQTGKLNWTYHTGTSGYETPYGIWPLWTFTVGTVADGKLYVPEGHMYSPPLFRGAKQLCLNATTGELIWDILAFDTTSAPAIADGYMVTLNAYDNQIYCYGKGQTATTVDAPMTAIPAGDTVVIRGTVTDQSPGAKGTPAIADEYMTPWMEYLYMQQPCPTNATGVEVTLDAVDPNGNFINIGTATSDAYGGFGYAWKTPEVPGKYAIIATFQGSESYWTSYAETFAVVVEAPAPPPPTPTPLVLPPYETYTVGAAVAVIIAIAIAVVLLYRRH